MRGLFEFCLFGERRPLECRGRYRVEPKRRHHRQRCRQHPSRGTGSDTLDGGAGNDTLMGGAGADSLIGGSDRDAASYYFSSAAVRVSLVDGLGAGGEATGDTLVGIEHLVGSAFDDVLLGDAGGNILNAGAGDDFLRGGAGVDTLDGGAGRGGADVLVGGAGTDRFVFATFGDSTPGLGVDLIADFSRAEGDVVDLTVARWAGLPLHRERRL
ncbi:hypothetical protein [Muricoccus radiodurans]|uniref:hypothetical protein n=1 Tax=Muricoccus radiodurans TaxID=2231721 RepID=UPI003CF77F33